MDAFGLAQLQRRIKDAAQSKAKARMREKEGGLGYKDQDQTIQKSGDFSLRFNPGETLRGSTKGGKDGTREDRGGIRKRYQDLAEVQQKASILLEEYQSYAAIRMRNQVTIDTYIMDTRLYCIMLYCIVLYCIVLYCIVLYCIVLYCIVLYCIVLYCIVL